jgi:hypothetical protein
MAKYWRERERKSCNPLYILCLTHIKLIHYRQIAGDTSTHVFIPATTQCILKSYVLGCKNALEVTCKFFLSVSVQYEPSHEPKTELHFMKSSKPIMNIHLCAHKHTIFLALKPLLHKTCRN